MEISSFKQLKDILSFGIILLMAVEALVENFEAPITCQICFQTRNARGELFSSIANHLRVHQVGYKKYLEQFPGVRTFSDQYSEIRAEVAFDYSTERKLERMNRGMKQRWQDIMDTFNREGYLSTSDVAKLIGTTRQSILKAVREERIKAFANVIIPSKDPRKKVQQMMLFQIPDILDFQSKRKKLD